MNRILSFALISLLVLLPAVSNAQNTDARKSTRKGNREYRSKKYDRAEDLYRRAIHYDSNAYRAHYNIGNTLYRQKKYDEAAQHYGKALQQPDLKGKARSNMYHNRGNSYLKAGLNKENRADGMEQFQNAVNDYQEALKLDPKNSNTRYNLAYAKKMLQQAQQQQKQQGGGGGGNDNNKDKNKNGNNGDNGNNGQDKQNQQNQQGQQNDRNKNQNQQGQQGNQGQQDKQQQNKQPQKQDPRKQDAERLLEAVKNNERNTMKENAKKVEVASPGRIEKDW